jgi:cobalt-zinc-cadmium efflux system protein
MAHFHHSHHGEGDLARRELDARRLRLALALILGLLAAELAAGVIANSLALLSDAAHMLTDAVGLGLSLLALRLALRPARGAMTFGLRRVEILSAQANGISLLIFAGLITYEGVRRLFEPPTVRAGLILGVALAGALVNVAAVRVLAGADRGSLNLEGSFQHVLTDLYGFLGTALAAALILFTGFQRADPIVSLLIAAIMARSGYGLVRAAGRVFLEAAPEGLSPQEIGEALVSQPGVVEVHDLHVWEVSSGFPALSAHVLVSSQADCHRARREMEAMLRRRFALRHTTLQVDHQHDELLGIEPLGAARASARAAEQR